MRKRRLSPKQVLEFIVCRLSFPNQARQDTLFIGAAKYRGSPNWLDSTLSLTRLNIAHLHHLLSTFHFWRICCSVSPFINAHGHYSRITYTSSMHFYSRFDGTSDLNLIALMASTLGFKPDLTLLIEYFHIFSIYTVEPRAWKWISTEKGKSKRCYCH